MFNVSVVYKVLNKYDDYYYYYSTTLSLNLPLSIHPYIMLNPEHNTALKLLPVSLNVFLTQFVGLGS